jgi:hypothetical protein
LLESKAAAFIKPFIPFVTPADHEVPFHLAIFSNKVPAAEEKAPPA